MTTPPPNNQNPNPPDHPDPTCPERFAPGLEAFLVDVGELMELEGNPRRGDVEAIARSYREFGQRTPLVYQTRVVGDGGVERMVVVAGNHQLQAVRDVLGWSYIAAVSADDLTVEQAQAFVVADNRVGQLGGWDDLGLIGFLDGMNDDLLGVTGFTLDDVRDLLPAEGFLPEDGVGTDIDVSSVYAVTVVVGSEKEQRAAFEALSASYDDVRVVTV